MGALSFIAGIVYFLKGQKATIKQGGELTSRSEEYINSRKKQSDDTQWRSVNFDKKRSTEEDLASQTLTFENCYSVPVPFSIANKIEREECVNAITLSPTGTLVIAVRNSSIKSYDDIPDVSLRRLKKEEYTEKEEIFGNKTFLTFKNKGGSYEKAAFLLEDSHMITIALTVPSNDNLDAKFEVIVKGLELE